MNSLHDQFTLTPEILQGMDGRSIIPQNVDSLRGLDCEGGHLIRAGDGVDACILAAMNDAERYQNNKAGDVLEHLKYQRLQLSILIRNLESLPE